MGAQVDARAGPALEHVGAGSDVEFQLEADGARLVVSADRAAGEIARMRGAGDIELSTDEILALTRR